MSHTLQEIAKNKDVTIKVLRYTDVDISDLDLTIFNVEEQTEFNSFKSTKRQLEYYFVRVLWLSFYQNEFIKYKSTGKPILNIGFISISHSHYQVAIAFSETKEVGMDLEHQSEKIQIIKSKYLHPNEIYSSTKDLTKIWTIKEAVYKLYDSKTLFFKEHIIVSKLIPAVEAEISLDGCLVEPNIIIIELKNNFIISFAQ